MAPVSRPSSRDLLNQRAGECAALSSSPDEVIRGIAFLIQSSPAGFAMNAAHISLRHRVGARIKKE